MLYKLLIVDDNKDINTILKIILQGAGYEVFVACSVREACTVLKSVHPDLILLDILITDQHSNTLADGRDLCRALKSGSESADMKIIMMSSYEESQESIAEFGGDDFIAKPFSIDYLLHRIQMHLSMQKSEKLVS